MKLMTLLIIIFFMIVGFFVWAYFKNSTDNMPYTPSVIQPVTPVVTPIIQPQNVIPGQDKG